MIGRGLGFPGVDRLGRGFAPPRQGADPRLGRNRAVHVDRPRHAGASTVVGPLPKRRRFPRRERAGAIDAPLGLVQEAAGDQLSLGRAQVWQDPFPEARHRVDAGVVALAAFVGADELDDVAGALIGRLAVVGLEVVDQGQVARPLPAALLGEAQHHRRLLGAVALAVLGRGDPGEVVGGEQQPRFSHSVHSRLAVEGVAMVAVGNPHDRQLVLAGHLLPVHVPLVLRYIRAGEHGQTSLVVSCPLRRYSGRDGKALNISLRKALHVKGEASAYFNRRRNSSRSIPASARMPLSVPRLRSLACTATVTTFRLSGWVKWWWLPLERASFQPFLSRTRTSCRGRTDGSRPLTRRR